MAYVMFPKTAVIQLTNYCNVSCVMCPTTMAKPKRMSQYIFEKIVSQLCTFESVERLEFAGGITEPTLHPSLIDFINIAKKYNFKDIGLITNGTRLNKLAEELVQSPLTYIIVSLYGSNEEIHLKYQSSSLFDVENGIIKLLQQKKIVDNKLNVFLVYAPFQSDLGDIIKYREKWENFDVEVKIRKLHNALGVVGGTFQHNECCSNHIDTITINSNGNVVSCCINSEDVKVFEHIDSSYLYDIYHGVDFNNWRERRLVLHCKNCSGLS